ncbi:MAG: ABC transporter permease [Steroidobacteraceae bacterium]
MNNLRGAFITDATHALKRVLRRPAFTSINSVTLGLALGASVLAFAVLYGYLFKPLPYDATGQLLLPRERFVKEGINAPEVSVRFYHTLTQLPEFRDAGLFNIDSGAVTVNHQHEVVDLTRLTPSTLTLLGVKPLLGRTLSNASGKPDGPHEVVISYAIWQSAFGGNSDVLGRTLEVGGTTMRVVGVMPQKFVFPYPRNALWTPFVITPARTKDSNINHVMLIRMPFAWNLSRLNALLATIRDRELRDGSPAFQATAKKGGYVIDALPYRQVLLSYAGGPAMFWGLFGFTLLLLVLTTLNSTNLALAHQRERLGDLNLRQVLGAGRGAIVRATLLEFLPVLVLMSVIGAVLAAYCIDLLHAYQLPSPYMPFEIRFGSTTIIYLIVAALIVMLCVTGSAVGASLLSRPSVSALQELAQRGTASRAFRRVQRIMAATQIGIALVLIICSALLSQSLIALVNQPLHFRSQHLTVASVLLPHTTTVPEFWQGARPIFRDLPGTRSVALSDMAPFGMSSTQTDFYPTGNRGGRRLTWHPAISSGFFEAMGSHLLAGRPFGPTDERPGSNNVIVSAALARAFYGKTDVVGKTLNGNLRIIGVAPTLPWQLDPDSDNHGYTVYSPIAADQGTYVDILIRSNADPAALMPAIRRAATATVPGAAIDQIYTLPQMMEQASLNREAFTWLVVGFGALAFLIAVFGVYATVAYGTRLRLFEFAIRQVVGASRKRVLALALREMVVLLLAGGTVGIALAYVIAQGLRSLLYGVGLLDPATYLGSVALIAAAVFVAAALPVWRATRLNPAEIMRE